MNKLETFYKVLQTPTPESQRRGQFLMNSLAGIDPSLYIEITIDYPEVDCFYDDSRILDFVELVSARLTRELFE